MCELSSGSPAGFTSSRWTCLKTAYRFLVLRVKIYPLHDKEITNQNVLSFISLSGHLVRIAAGFRWRSGRQRHPGVQSGSASLLTTRQPASRSAAARWTANSESRVSQDRNQRGEEPGGERSPGQEREGTGWERRGREAPRCRQTGPRTPTD